MSHIAVYIVLTCNIYYYYKIYILWWMVAMHFKIKSTPVFYL